MTEIKNCIIFPPCMSLSFPVSRAENRERRGEGWDSKRIANGSKTDRKRMTILLLSSFYPFAILFLSVCYPLAVRLLLCLLSHLSFFLIFFRSVCFPFPILLRSHLFPILFLSYLRLWKFLCSYEKRIRNITTTFLIIYFLFQF